MTPFYITCFNDPERCRLLLAGLRNAGHLQNRKVFLSDQSDDDFAAAYQRLADEFRVEHIRHENAGATMAKRAVLNHAKGSGFNIVHQCSEDFLLGDCLYPGLASGASTFLSDSRAILDTYPDLAFVRWCLFTGIDGDMSYMWRHQQWFGGLIFKAISSSILPFLTGAVQYSNWPATWRVDQLLEMWRVADSWVPPTQEDADHVKGSGGEWAASQCKAVKGAVLVAQPMRHPDRIKHAKSLH